MNRVYVYVYFPWWNYASDLRLMLWHMYLDNIMLEISLWLLDFICVYVHDLNLENDEKLNFTGCSLFIKMPEFILHLIMCFWTFRDKWETKQEAAHLDPHFGRQPAADSRWLAANMWNQRPGLLVKLLFCSPEYLYLPKCYLSYWFILIHV